MVAKGGIEPVTRGFSVPSEESAHSVGRHRIPLVSDVLEKIYRFQWPRSLRQSQ
jgi:hypothetical protein